MYFFTIFFKNMGMTKYRLAKLSGIPNATLSELCIGTILTSSHRFSFIIGNFMVISVLVLWEIIDTP